jgi:predicted ArsR family transcriptional regulator
MNPNRSKPNKTQTELYVALQQYGNVPQAAKALGLTTAAVYYRVRKTPELQQLLTTYRSKENPGRPRKKYIV